MLLLCSKNERRIFGFLPYLTTFIDCMGCSRMITSTEIIQMVNKPNKISFLFFAGDVLTAMVMKNSAFWDITHLFY
jgi:hypothetical protein